MLKNFALACTASIMGLSGSLPAFAAEPAEIRLAYALNADKSEQLAKLVERFNASSKVGQIKLVPWAGNADADLILPPEEDELGILASRKFKPLWEVMRDAKEPLDALRQVPRMVMPVSLDDKGRLQALPMTLSTPVVYVNRATLQQAGIDADNLPKTWLGWQNELGKLIGNGSACPFTTTRPVQVFMDNTGAWNAQAATKFSGKDEVLATNGLMHVKHMAMMMTWHKANYLKLFGYSDDAEAQFVSGNCAVMVASSASFPDLQRKTKFDVGVASLPYHEGAFGAPQNTLADGASLWVATGRKDAAYKTAARFVSFFLTPENQISWQVNAGYLPLNRSGIVVTTETSLLKDELRAQKVAIASLINKPVISASVASTYMRRNGVRRVLQQEMDAVWAGSKTPKQALDDAVVRARTL